MKVEVLISCMHQTDASIITRTNVQSDVLVINQCDKDGVEEHSFFNKESEECRARIIHTTERGLSRSRNMAIRNATGDVCLVCDDDECLYDDYYKGIAEAFEQNPDYDVIAFRVDYPRKTYPLQSRKIGYIDALKVSSVQIAFRRESVVRKNVFFNEKMGAGTGNGGGEENKFLYDCLRAGLKMWYVPFCIAKIGLPGEDSWFKGFDSRFCFNKGWSIKMTMGLPLAWCYAVYFSVTKFKKYRAENNFFSVLYHLLRGTLKRVK